MRLWRIRATDNEIKREVREYQALRESLIIQSSALETGYSGRLELRADPEKVLFRADVEVALRDGH